MSYLVLARKYRPATFSEVIGQEHVTRTLTNAFASGRVHHAFLFCGPRGCGKTTLARIVGKALNCQAPEANGRATPEPCGTCSACASIGNGSSVDYQEMDGASNRGIDAIRELTEAVRYQPAVLRKKVYVIDEVHMLTTEAFNALLKTLEEPPPHVTFVLATTEPHKLPNTILSRCQRYDFKLVPASRLSRHLADVFKREGLAIEAGAVSLLVRESGGSVRDALSLGDQIISYVGSATITEAHVAEVLGVADRSLTRTLVGALAAGDAGAALAAVESAIERGVDEVQIARAIVRYLRDLSVVQVAPDRAGLVDATDDERAELVAEAGRVERTRVTQMFERMLRCCDELGKTLQPRLILDCALIDVATVEPLVPLGDLIERLGSLELRLASGGASTARVRATASAPARPAAPPVSPGAMAPPPVAPPAVQMAAGGGMGMASAGGAPAARAPGRGSSSASTSASSSAAPSASSSASSASSAAKAATKPTARGSGPSDHVPAAEPPAKFAKGTAPGNASARSIIEAERAGGRSAPPRDDDRSSAAFASDPRGGDPRDSMRDDPREARSASPPARDARSAPGAPMSIAPSGAVPQAANVASGSGPNGLEIPTSAEAALVAWNDVLSELEARRKFTLLGPFQLARVMKWTAEEIELGFPVDVHSMGEMANERQTIDDLRSILHEIVPAMRAKSAKVSVRMLDETESQSASARSVLETTRERGAVEKTKREAEAREHPITKHVLQTFGAQIKEIKTDV